MHTSRTSLSLEKCWKLQYNSSWGLWTCEWTGILSHSFHKTSWRVIPFLESGFMAAREFLESVKLWTRRDLRNHKNPLTTTTKGLKIPASDWFYLPHSWQTYSERDLGLPQHSQTLCSIWYLCQGLWSSLLGTFFIKGTIFYPGYERKHMPTYEDTKEPFYLSYGLIHLSKTNFF